MLVVCSLQLQIGKGICVEDRTGKFISVYWSMLLFSNVALWNASACIRYVMANFICYRQNGEKIRKWESFESTGLFSA